MPAHRPAARSARPTAPTRQPSPTSPARPHSASSPVGHQAPLTSGTSRNTQPKLTRPEKSPRAKMSYAGWSRARGIERCGLAGVGWAARPARFRQGDGSSCRADSFPSGSARMIQLTPGGWPAWTCGAGAGRAPVQPAGRRPAGSGPGRDPVPGLLRLDLGRRVPGAVHRRSRDPVRPAWRSGHSGGAERVVSWLITARRP